MISVDDKGPFPPCPAPFNLATHVLWSNRANDNKVAMAVLGTDGVSDWTYGRLREAVLRTAAGLLNSDLKPGDRIFLRLGNTPYFPITFLAAISAGILPVPVAAGLTDREFAKLCDVISPAETVGNCDSKMLDPETLALADPLDAPVVGDPERPAYIVFTSGTLGRAMGVVHAHRAIWARQAMHSGWYDIRPTDRLLHAGAFNWTYTLGTGLFDPWSVGATALVAAEDTDPSHLPILMQQHDATLFAAAPGVFRRLLRSEIPTLPKLRHAFSAGEKLPETLRTRWKALTGKEIYEAFGQSECSTFISSSPDHPAPVGAIGSAQPGRRIAVLGPNGPVPREKPGEIAISADDPGVMLGYFEAPDATAARHRDGWFLTGDTGQMSIDGAITYLGRRDDILTAGGYRISPLDIEDAMMKHPKVEDAAAVDEKLDAETTVVALHYASDDPIETQTLSSHASEHLARYKQPRIYHHHNSLPRGRGGKLLRARLRAATDNL
ncbi:MAG: class I adenylate-forming enzyme family protein [Boseongicola sp.]